GQGDGIRPKRPRPGGVRRAFEELADGGRQRAGRAGRQREVARLRDEQQIGRLEVELHRPIRDLVLGRQVARRLLLATASDQREECDQNDQKERRRGASGGRARPGASLAKGCTRGCGNETCSALQRTGPCPAAGGPPVVPLAAAQVAVLVAAVGGGAEGAAGRITPIRVSYSVLYRCTA